MTPAEIVLRLRELGVQPLALDDIVVLDISPGLRLPPDLADWRSHESAIADHLRAEAAANAAARSVEIQSIADGVYFARAVDQAAEHVLQDPTRPDDNTAP